MSILGVISIIFFLIIIGLGLWFMYLVLSEKKRPNNPPIIINYKPHRTGGYRLGIAKKIEEREDRVHIIFSPRLDIDSINLENQKKEEKDLKDYHLFVEKTHFRPNTFYKNRKAYNVYPSKWEYLPKDVQESEEGEQIKQLVEKLSSHKDTIDINRIRTETMKNMIISSESKDYLQELINPWKDLSNEKEKLIKKESEK